MYHLGRTASNQCLKTRKPSVEMDSFLAVLNGRHLAHCGFRSLQLRPHIPEQGLDVFARSTIGIVKRLINTKCSSSQP